MAAVLDPRIINRKEDKGETYAFMERNLKKFYNNKWSMALSSLQ